MTKEKKKRIGRPPKYKTPEQMQKAIDAYFKDCPDQAEVFVGGEIGVITVPSPTITGLALYLGFCDRFSMYEYEQRPEFTDTIKNARARMVNIYEQNVTHGKNPSGAIFMLKNFGYSDKQELKVESKQEITVNRMDINERLEMFMGDDDDE